MSLFISQIPGLQGIASFQDAVEICEACNDTKGEVRVGMMHDTIGDVTYFGHDCFSFLMVL